MSLTFSGQMESTAVDHTTVVAVGVSNIEAKMIYRADKLFLEIELQNGSTIELHGMDPDLANALEETYRLHTTPEEEL